MRRLFNRLPLVWKTLLPVILLGLIAAAAPLLPPTVAQAQRTDQPPQPGTADLVDPLGGEATDNRRLDRSQSLRRLDEL